MKRLRIAVITFSLLLLLCTVAFAASNTFALKELDLELSIPEGYSVITRNTPVNDPVFGEVGTTKAEMDRILSEKSIYLNAISRTYSEEIVVTMSEVSLTNFSVLGDTALDALGSGLEEMYRDYGIHVSQYSVYHHSQAKFIEVYFTDVAETVHGLQYYTIYNGKAMNFTMRSYEGYLSSRQKSAIKTLVDSIRFYSEPLVADTEETPSFAYTDFETDIKFTVPENWKQEALSKKREYIDVKFISTKEADCCMIYGSTDLWAELPTSEKQGMTRAVLNESYLSKSDIAEVFGISGDKVSSVTYGGKKYYRMELSASASDYGIDATVTMTCLVRLENGWMYVFQFGGKNTHTLYSDFEKLLKSVQYPIPAAESRSSELVGYPTLEEALGEPFDFGPLLVVIVIVVVTTVIIIIVIRRKKEEENSWTPVEEEMPPLKLGTNCKNCGQKLPADSNFCHICGTKLER